MWRSDFQSPLKTYGLSVHSGLVIQVAKEELKIRQDPSARASDLLKKVFGN